jgi:hypothetical protein
MKALRYFFCVVLPPLAVLLTGRIASFLSQPHFDFAGLDSGRYSRLPGRQ